MIAQPQQMELDSIRERVSGISTITITTRRWSLNYEAENKTADVYNIIVRANGKIISERNPIEWHYKESVVRSTDGGISDFFKTNNIHTWTEGDNTISYDEMGVATGHVVYQASDAFNCSIYEPEKVSFNLYHFGLKNSGETINIRYSVTVETV